MPPYRESNDILRKNSNINNDSLNTNQQLTQQKLDNDALKSNKEYKLEIKWLNVLGYSVLHLGALYGAYVALTQAKWSTLIFTYFFYIITGFGGTAGVHRLWSHRAYKATWQLRLILAYFNCVLYIGPIYEWTRDHRCHHKYTETDADPYNAKRGLFFSHIGWLMCKKHSDVIKAGRKIDLSDIESDPICRYQRKYYLPLAALACFITPTFIPLLWHDTKWVGFWVLGILRYVLQLHAGFFVNSIAHCYGRKPYDKNIYASENHLVSFYVGGEGFHNYHHTFPWDYGASELGWRWNPAKTFIDFMALIGWAYDLRIVSPEMIKLRKEKTGDIKEKGPYGYY